VLRRAKRDGPKATPRQAPAWVIPEGIAADMGRISEGTGSAPSDWFFLATEATRPEGFRMARGVMQFVQDAATVDKPAFLRVEAWLRSNLPVTLAPKAPKGADALERLAQWVTAHAPGEFAAVTSAARATFPALPGDVWERRRQMDALVVGSVTIDRKGDGPEVVYHGHPPEHVERTRSIGTSKDVQNQGVNPDFVCGTPERA